MPFLKYANSAKDYVMIVFGLFLYAFGFCAFILPHEVVIGGLAGVGTLVYFATNGKISVAITSYACNLLLLPMAITVAPKTVRVTNVLPTIL